MKNYCLVSFCNIYVLPYAKTYIDEIIKSGNKCTLLFWDRDAVDGENDQYEGCEKICYQMKINPESTGVTKLVGYLKAARFFNRVLEKTDFEGIVFLQTHAAIMCKNILLKKFRNRYIVDIRDYTWENFAPYKWLEEKTMKEAYSVVISSPAYRKFLPKREYIIAHNYTPFSEDVIREIRESSERRQNSPVGISFVGTIRFLDMDKKILQLFKNDERFKINYFGTGSDVLKTFAEDNHIDNVEFYGSFKPIMTTEFYKKTDLINNVYGNHDRFLDFALSNKLYHSGQFHIPILVCPETYMEEIALQYHMGFVLDVNDKESPDKLFKWFRQLDRQKLAKGCDSFIETVKLDNEKFTEMIICFLRK